MFEHLGNCHGEWTMLLGGIPIIGVWFKMMLARRAQRKLQESTKDEGCPCGHEGNEVH